MTGADAETMALIRRLHEIPGCETGGPLHVVVDDSNVEDRSLEFAEAAIDELPGQPGDRHGMGWWRDLQTAEETAEMVAVSHEIIARLRSMSEAQREATTECWADEPGWVWP